jgi:hypothetical protein
MASVVEHRCVQKGSDGREKIYFVEWKLLSPIFWFVSLVYPDSSALHLFSQKKQIATSIRTRLHYLFVSFRVDKGELYYGSDRISPDQQ